ncbi:hypothetical protein CCP3SC15_550013 [Gammaproteobacteria bacterium]
MNRDGSRCKCKSEVVVKALDRQGRWGEFTACKRHQADFRPHPSLLLTGLTGRLANGKGKPDSPVRDGAVVRREEPATLTVVNPADGQRELALAPTEAGAGPVERETFPLPPVCYPVDTRCQAANLNGTRCKNAGTARLMTENPEGRLAEISVCKRHNQVDAQPHPSVPLPTNGLSGGAGRKPLRRRA